MGPRTVLDILENRISLASAGKPTIFPRYFSSQLSLYCNLAISFADKCEEYQKQE